MDILIRNVNPVAVKKIDELAKKKLLSRNEYIKNMIEDLSILELKDSKSDHLEKQIEANNLFMKKTSDSLDELVYVLKELLVDE